MPNIVNKFETFTANPAGRQGLYCVWIRWQEIHGAPLIAVWIDPQMRALEQSLSNDGESVASPALAAGSDGPDDEDGPGHPWEEMALWMAGFIAFVWLIGFIPAIALFVFAYMRFGFGEPSSSSAGFAAATTLLCIIVFHWALQVAWPQSLLGDVFPALRAATHMV